jgi:hypothetical protein
MTSGQEEDSGTRHVRMPMPPGGDAGRDPGSPRIGERDPDAPPTEGNESSGQPHSGHRHQVADDEGLPGESSAEEAISPPGEH